MTLRILQRTSEDSKDDVGQSFEEIKEPNDAWASTTPQWNDFWAHTVTLFGRQNSITGLH